MRRLLFIPLLLVMGSTVLAASSQQCFPEITCRVTEAPKTQVVAGGQTVVADACGSLKALSAAGAVVTSLVDTFDEPNKGNSGCGMDVCNVGANAITLDNNARFVSAGAADVVLGANDCVRVVSTGLVWMQVSPASAN